MQLQHEKIQLSDLLVPIERALNLYNTPQKLAQMKFTLELHLLMLQKLPQMYVSNREHSIQAELKTQKSKPTQQFPLDPFNKIKTHYYMHTPKSYIVLNCHQKELQNQPQQFQDAYKPQFYFSGQKWQQFQKQRVYIKKTQSLDTIYITEWGLKVINVSLSGHYGVILQIYKSRRGNGQVQVKLPFITSIMYEEQIAKRLSRIRLEHVKRIIAHEPEIKKQQKTSMCYHLRASKTNIKVAKGLQFVSIDNNGQIIAHDKLKRRNYVTVGDLQGMCSFPQSINLSEAHQDNQSRLNMQLQAYDKNSVISNIFKLKKQIQEQKMQKKLQEEMKRKNSEDSFELPFSQSSEQEGQIQLQQRYPLQVDSEKENSQSSEEDQYFKKYREQAKNNRII